MTATDAGSVSTSNQVFTGLAGGPQTSAPASGNAAPALMAVGEISGMLVVIAGLFAGFALML
jgi:hypothetical protein